MSDKEQVVLIERLGRLQSFNLPHEQFCVAGRCSCQEQVVRLMQRSKATGKAHVKLVRKRMPASLTLLPRTRSRPLPKAVLECPEIKAALKARPRRLSWVAA